MKVRAYAIAFFAGLLLVLVGGWARQRAFPAEWQKHQNAYNAWRVSMGSPAIDVGIRSIRVAGRQEDRCPTCHLGTVLQPAQQAPLRAHPPTGCALPIAQQGCSSCHRGEGLRLTRDGAHGMTADSRSPLADGADKQLRPTRLESGCAGCHLTRSSGVLRYEPDKVPHVARGLLVFLSEGCASCHRIDGVASAGEHGPGLTAIARRRTRDALGRLLESPRGTNPSSPMPPLRASADAREALLTFLLAQVGPEQEPGCSASCAMQAAQARPSVTEHFDERAPERANPAAGALWARRIGCTGCHRAASGDSGAADLTRAGWYRTEEQLRKTLRDPRSFAPATWMPAPNVPDSILESMVAWLALQKAPLPSAPADVWKDVCARCHGRDRDAKVVVLSKLPPVHTKSGIERAKFIDRASKGVEGTAMPPWGRMLSPAFLGGVYDAMP